MERPLQGLGCCAGHVPIHMAFSPAQLQSASNLFPVQLLPVPVGPLGMKQEHGKTSVFVHWLKTELPKGFAGLGWS